MTETVAVTGGNGQIGRALLAHLADGGYHTVNLSRGRREEDAADRYVQTDTTDPGAVYGALGRADPDAVVHLGMLPTPERTPGHVTFESNAMSAYLVLEAAGALGVDTVTLASSLSAIGGGFEPDPVRVDYLPVDETHPLTPSNPYGLGKQVLEVVADGIARRAGAPTTISSVRFPWVVTDADARETFVAGDRTLDGLRAAGTFHTARNTLFAYLHIEDAVSALGRTLEAEFGGHERFWTVAADTTAAHDSETLAREVYPDATVAEALTGHRSLIATAKARELLDWAPTRSWRELV